MDKRVVYMSLFMRSWGMVHMSGPQPRSCPLLGGSKATFLSNFHTLRDPAVTAHVHGWPPRIPSSYCPVFCEHHLMLGTLLGILFVVFQLTPPLPLLKCPACSLLLLCRARPNEPSDLGGQESGTEDLAAGSNLRRRLLGRRHRP